LAMSEEIKKRMRAPPVLPKSEPISPESIPVKGHLGSLNDKTVRKKLREMQETGKVNPRIVPLIEYLAGQPHKHRRHFDNGLGIMKIGETGSSMFQFSHGKRNPIRVVVDNRGKVLSGKL